MHDHGLDEETLRSIAEMVVGKEEERSHMEETGAEMVHFEAEIDRVEAATFVSGRSGDFYKFAFEYTLTFIDDAHLEGTGHQVRRFRRTVRLDLDGKLSGVGDRQPL